MQRVFKYPVPIGDHFSVLLPQGAKILRFANQHEQACLWCLVDPDAQLQARAFRMAGTGHQISEPAENLAYVGTELFQGGMLVFHLFEFIP